MKRQRTIVGVLIREVRAKLGVLDAATSTNPSANTDTAAVVSTGKALPLPSTLGTPSALGKLTNLLERAYRIRTQTRHTKNKLYALHAPKVECISKGKARNRYEFGAIFSLAITHKQGLMVGTKRFAGNPFDGHTLTAQLTQTNGLIATSGKLVKRTIQTVT